MGDLNMRVLLPTSQPRAHPVRCGAPLRANRHPVGATRMFILQIMPRHVSSQW